MENRKTKTVGWIRFVSVVLCFSLLALLASPECAKAADPAVYIATDGSGDYNCDGTDDEIEINEAIDYIKSQGGGTVRLKSGTYIINASIEMIQMNNLTLQGAGVDETILKTDEEDICMIVASPLENNDFIIHEETGGAAQQDPRLKNAPYYSNITIKDIRMIGPGIRVENGKAIDAVLYAKMEYSTISNVTIEDFGDAIRLYRSDDNTLKNIEIKNNNRGGFFFSVGQRNTVENCLIENMDRWYGLDFNGGCCNNKVVDCTFRKCLQGSLKIYSGSGSNEISGSIFDGTGRSNGGVIIMNGYNNLIRGNIFTSFKQTTDYAAVVQKSGGGGHPPEHYNYDNRIINNVFYANQGDAILLVVGAYLEIRNNIIVQNQGAALADTNPAYCTYNNVWNNAGGDGGGEGTGTISTDPLFADPDNGVFHLKSQYGRWTDSGRVYDSETSPCIDAGDPADDYSNELEPNGGRINMGAYGNTNEASKSEGEDNTPPIVALKTITINGSVDVGTVTEVEINGTIVYVTAGVYSHEVDVTSTNIITIVATNNDSKTVTRTINIK